jgi:hypothetical protein
LTQALGNCVQPLTHRGSLNIQPNVLGNRRGVYTGKNWSSSKYADILPTAGSEAFADIPGYRAGDWNSVNYDGSQFYFPTDNHFNTSNFYGGDTTNIGGDTNFQNINTQNMTVHNLTVTGGTSGGGVDGRDGDRGEPGPPGDPGSVEPISPPGGGGQGQLGYPSETVRFVTGLKPGGSGNPRVIKIKSTTSSVEVVTGATFDAESCSIQLATTTIDYVSEVNFEVSGRTASTFTIKENFPPIPQFTSKTFLKPNR